MLDYYNFKDIKDFESLISSTKDFDEFQRCIEGSRINNQLPDVNFHYYLLDFKNRVVNNYSGKVKNIIYSSYWNYFRHIIKLYHRLNRIDVGVFYYKNLSKDIFLEWENNGLKKRIFDPIYSDSTEESNNPILNYYKNFNKLKNAYNVFYDDKSKEVFMALVKTRLSLNLEFINKVGSDPGNEYLEDFINFGNNSFTFVDAGAYDGDSALKILESYNNFNRAFLFEPNYISSRRIEKKLSSYKKSYHILNYALSDKDQTATFSLNGEGSRVVKSDYNETRKFDTRIVKLDSIINEEISFIKMDIEGFELRALHGAQQIIRKYRPLLAINVDHQISDLWQIVNYLDELKLDYRFYLRHYLHSKIGLFGTILYAV